MPKRVASVSRDVEKDRKRKKLDKLKRKLELVQEEILNCSSDSNSSSEGDLINAVYDTSGRNIYY